MDRDFDTLVLRTFVAAAECGEFAHASRVVGRSQGAVSMQIQKLERVVDQTLFLRGKLGVSLTDAGRRFLPHAKNILDAKDHALREMTGFDVEGEVRVGMPQDFAETFLPGILGAFARSHPSVQLTAHVDRNVDLGEAVRRGNLDIALTFGLHTITEGEVLAEIPAVWIGPKEYRVNDKKCVPLVAFNAPCIFREIAENSLTNNGLQHFVSMNSASLQGLWTGINAGLGIAVRTLIQLPPHLVVLSRETGLPPLPSVKIRLHHAEHITSEAVVRLKSILKEEIAAHLPMNFMQ
ncbi:MAG: LysR substrate-binding domain-containing protein [Pseudoruegeria sp.]